MEPEIEKQIVWENANEQNGTREQDDASGQETAGQDGKRVGQGCTGRRE